MFQDRRLILGLLLLFLAVSCVEPLDTPETIEGGLVPVQLAFSLQGDAASTKAVVTTITEMGDNPLFRGMDDIYIIPFSSTSQESTLEVIAETDESLGMIRSLPSINDDNDTQAWSGTGNYHKGLIQNCNAHLYPDASVGLPRETASVLVYGQAPRLILSNEQKTKRRNGSLIVEGLNSTAVSVSANSIRFHPDPIYASAASESSVRIARILTHIVTSSYTQQYYYLKNGVSMLGRYTVTWDENIGDPFLLRYFNWITGEGQLMTGGGSYVLSMINTLYHQLSLHESFSDRTFKHVEAGVEYEAVLTEGGSDTFTYAYLYDKLRDAILTRFVNLVNYGLLDSSEENIFTFGHVSDCEYPTSLGLPDGSAVLRWDGIEFKPVSEQGLDGIAAMNRFCYMPSLFYYVNTSLKTASDTEIYKKYTSNYDWSAILSNYYGAKVSMSTRSVALVNPLRYACGKCVMTVRATNTILPDNDGDSKTNVTIGTTNFPVTGIIIGGQYTQNFNFTPDKSSTQYFLYDNDLYAEGENEVCLVRATSAENLRNFQTLVLPTPVGDDVYFCLEFRNDSGKSFTGVDGIVLPGNHFYMTGRLELPQATDQAFAQHSVTTVDCIVSSMENAHVCVPELGAPQLTLGVQTQINWIMSTPAQIPLE